MSPKAYGLAFHHFGLAARAPETALRFLTGLGYEPGPTIFDPIQTVNLILCRHTTMPDVELIYPSGESGPVDRLLERHKEGLVYHLCFTTRDLDASLAAMEDEAGLRVFCVAPPEPAILFGGKRVSFYVVDGFGLIEILEETLDTTAIRPEAPD